MKRAVLLLLIFTFLLTGCTSMSSSAIQAIKEEAYQEGYSDGQSDLEGFVPEDEAIDFVLNNYSSEIEERVLDNMISNDFNALLDRIVTDSTWDSVEEYLMDHHVVGLTAIAESSASENTSDSKIPPNEEPEAPYADEADLPSEEFPDDDAVYTQLYVLNVNTKKFHYQSCSSATQMNAENRQERETTRDQLIAEGYSPCARCNP